MSFSSAAVRWVRARDPAVAAVFVLAFLMPAVLPFGRRLGPVLLVCAALLSALSFVRAPGAFREALSRAPLLPCTLFAAFLGWAALTLLWTPAPARGAAAVASGALMVGAGLLVWIAPRKLDPAVRMRWQASGILVGSLVAALDLSTGRHLLAFLYERSEAHRYNVVLVSLVVLLWPLLAASVGKQWPLTAAALLALIWAVAVGESETAKVGLVAGLIAWALAGALPASLLASGTAAAVALPMIALPWIPEIGGLLARQFPELAAAGHAAERIAIWTSFSQMALAGMPSGWGVESVAIARETSFFAAASEDIRYGLNWMHPHNNLIQIAVEMGAPGLLIAAGLGFVYTSPVRRSDLVQASASAAMIVSVLSMSLIGGGLWQAWWWSAVATALCLSAYDRN